MPKRLITSDYKKIVFESLKIPESDFHNYYLNIVEENYYYNNEIILNLKKEVNQWLNWYNSKIYGKKIRVKMPDGSISLEDENQAWENDENGNMKPIDLEKTLIPLLFDFKINRKVNKPFFDNLISELNVIQEIIDFKKKVLEFENRIPELLKKELPKTPISNGFDYRELKERFKFLKVLTNENKIEKEIINDIQNKAIKWLINDKNVFNLPLDYSIPLSIINISLLGEITKNTFKTLSEYLYFKIDITKEISGTGGYNIQKILLEEINISDTNARYLKEHKKEIRVSYIYILIHLWLFKIYSENNHSEFLFIGKYKAVITKKQESFLDENIDTNNKDFINSEIKRCKNILKELKKPVYNNITLLGLQDEPNDFKKNLKNSIKRRLEFLKDIIDNELINVSTTNTGIKNVKVEELNIFCRSMKLDIPRNHFKVLTTNKSKNGNPFLTPKQLEDFIQKAFLGKELPKQIINFADGEKLLVQSVFYEFYNNNCFEYFETSQNQKIFIELLTNNFKGWDFKKLKGNFKPKTEKRLL